MPASLTRWVSRFKEEVAEDPKRGLLHAGYTSYLGFWYTLSSRYPIGRTVYEDDWDLLIVLDACRIDVLQEVRDEYDYLDEIGRRLSVGSHSREWLAKTFSRVWCDEVGRTAMISGNPHTQAVFHDGEYPPKEIVPFCRPKWDVVHSEDFARLEELWQYNHGKGYGVPPRPVTDRTIATSREVNPDRLIAHYMQPHIPYLSDVLAEGRELTHEEEKGWKALENDTLSAKEHWKLYRDNLRLVLDDIELLLENVDADQVYLTADHGNVFGEWGAYGHPEGLPHPRVKYVPWVTLSATDYGEYEPEYSLPKQSETTVEDRLGDLGYL